MSTETTSSTDRSAAAVLADLAAMLREVLDEYGLDDVEITPASTFHGDLALESVDLVALAAALRAHYGDRVNFAEFIATRDLDEIVSLTVGDLVTHVVDSLGAVSR